MSDLNDLQNKQNFALQYKLLNTLSQGVGKIANILLETVTITPLIANISFSSQVGKILLSRFWDRTQDIMNSFCFWSWILSSDQYTSLTTTNDPCNFKSFASVYLFSCWSGSFANVITLLKGISFFNCFRKGLPGFSWKTVTAVSWALAFPDNVFLMINQSGWSKLSKTVTVKLDGENWLGRAGPWFFLFLGQT